ncbi:hypothetical protein OBBRIDRAFT_256975 [Obba rivulosa]|uniref:RNA helicase n=1 Tax=Obba rivulosa TaxID=1052685 RepID=A0A8E2DFP3_9APHY|nr:hypothetical protein OBBRIDRAFT_256975 [Obba rivulosa]
MNSLLATCSRCRHDALRSHLLKKSIFIRSRAGGNSAKNKRAKAAREHGGQQQVKPAYAAVGTLYGPPSYTPPSSPRGFRGSQPPAHEDDYAPVRTSDVWAHLEHGVKGWSRSPTIYKMLQSFGVAVSDLSGLLSAYSKAMQSGEVKATLAYTSEQVDRIAYDLSHKSGGVTMDQWLSKILFEWVAHKETKPVLQGKVSEDTIATMTELFHAADLSQPYAFYPRARLNKPRTVIMHVGPTNSGKTHNALRALAAAETGVYGGPLRLLAAEIFERLNKGQIVPAGVDPDAGAEPDTDSLADIGDAQEQGKVVIQKDGDARFARPCNMITGEEQKFMGEEVGLVSCTVEMAPLSRDYDVAVLDEIQLIADPERGGAWTAAVLGVNARELHLCGEETAVPLVQAMLRDTGDKLIVNRYQRLTPLRAAETSLNGQVEELRKGDCIVTFSRKNILNIKKLVEKGTGMQCAVAYGRLPPEIRNEQAALFNDPDNNYGVLVGSDAIGLGLNLKIKRVIFEAVSKFDGTSVRPLPTALIKQIAGRAGRFGLHGADESGGIVSTFIEEDLEVVRKALVAPMAEHRFARLNLGYDTFKSIGAALPAGSGSGLVLKVLNYVSRLHPRYTLVDTSKVTNVFEFIDVVAPDIPIADQMLFTQAPVPWRDPLAVDVVGRMMLRYRTDMRVELYSALKESQLWERLEGVEDVKNGVKPQPRHMGDVLSTLETMHGIVTFYLWTSYRKPMAFPSLQDGFALKERTERLMDWCLDEMTTGEGGLSPRRPKEKIGYISGAEIRERRLQQRAAEFDQIKTTAGKATEGQAILASSEQIAPQMSPVQI